MRTWGHMIGGLSCRSLKTWQHGLAVNAPLPSCQYWAATGTIGPRCPGSHDQHAVHMTLGGWVHLHLSWPSAEGEGEERGKGICHTALLLSLPASVPNLSLHFATAVLCHRSTSMVVAAPPKRPRNF